MIIDISQEVFSCKVFPGDEKPGAKRAMSLEAGDICDLTVFTMCAHNGTHVDAPRHFLKDGKTIDELSLKTFVGDCYVARLSGKVTAEHVIEIMERARQADASGRILLAGDIELSEEAANAFAKANVRLLGCEAQSIAPKGSEAPVHNILLGADIAILEGTVLSDVMEGKYFLSAAPLNLGGCEGAPCRAYLIK